MTIGVSHDLETGNVVLVDATAKTIYDLSPAKAHQLASQLRAAAVSGASVLVVATATDGRLALDSNAAERALRGVAVGRKNWLFAGSDRGGERAAAMYSLIETPN